MEDEQISITFSRKDWELIAESLHNWLPYLNEQIAYPDPKKELLEKKISQEKQSRSLELGNQISEILKTD